MEDGIYDLAPDLASLTILGLEDEGDFWLRPLESLLKHPRLRLRWRRWVEVDGAD